MLDHHVRGVTANTRVIAVNVPNQQGLIHNWRAYRVNVKELEKLTSPSGKAEGRRQRALV